MVYLITVFGEWLNEQPELFNKLLLGVYDSCMVPVHQLLKVNCVTGTFALLLCFEPHCSCTIKPFYHPSILTSLT